MQVRRSGGQSITVMEGRLKVDPVDSIETGTTDAHAWPEAVDGEPERTSDEDESDHHPGRKESRGDRCRYTGPVPVPVPVHGDTTLPAVHTCRRPQLGKRQSTRSTCRRR